MTGQPRTVDEVAAPYANFLVRVPPAGPAVCRVCHSAVSGYPTCWQCKQAVQAFGGATADLTGFVSMAPRTEQLAHELFAYKRITVPSEARQRMTVGLAAVLWKWMLIHESCMTIWLGIDHFDVTTSVPSTSASRPSHPLKEVVASVVTHTEDRYEDLLTLNRSDLEQHTLAADRFRATRSLGGARVLVIDDTWTMGGNAQSASVALKAAGARTVAVVAIGRWFNPAYKGPDLDAQAWLAENRKPGWDWRRCCLNPEPGDYRRRNT